MLESAIIELTNLCNCQCIFCSSNSIKVALSSTNIISSNYSINYPGGIHTLPENEVARIVKELIVLGVKRIEISGGEPTLYPNTIIQILKLCDGYDIKVSIFTNGTFIDGLFKIINFLINSNIRASKDNVEFHLSMYSQDLNCYKKLVLSDNLPLVFMSSKNLIKKGLFVGWNFLVTRVNYRDYREIIRLANKHNVNMISFLRLVPQGRAKRYWSLLSLTADDYREFFDNILNLLREYEGETVLRFGCPINWFFKIVRSRDDIKSLREHGIYPPPTCKACEKHIAIEPDGTVIPCSAFKGLKNRFTLGSIFRDRLEAILSSESFKSFLKLKMKLPNACRTCTFRDICLGKCIAQRLYNKFEEVDPLCDYLRFSNLY